MSTYSGGWSTQQLAEFLTAIASYSDRAGALTGAVERVAEALEAEVAAVVQGDVVLAAVGFPANDIPTALLCRAAAQDSPTIALPLLGVCRVSVVALEAPRDARLLVARTGASEFVREEAVLLRAMGRGLALTVRSLAALEEERHLRVRSEAQSRENVRLVRQLQERQTLLERLAKIGQSISHRAPFTEVLEAIVRGASELVNAEIASFRLRDEANPDLLVILAQVGLAPDVLAEMALEPAARGASARSVAEDHLVVIADYPRFEGAVAALIRDGVQVAMAAPVRETGRVVGSLTVASREAGRVFTPAEQDTLVAFAEHASLALTDSKMAAAMQHQVLHDALTDLPNRTLFLDRLEHALARARREVGSMTGVLFIDLDRFKNVNDSLGHEAGDQLLVQLGRRLRGSIREVDTPARLGGDEFAVLVEGVAELNDVIIVAQRIRDNLRQPVTIGGNEIFSNPSIGVATSSDGREAASELLRNADTAMYRAKETGTRPCVVFEPTMHAAVMRRLELDADLARAVERNEFELHYQPVVRLEGETIDGAEALVRWRHPVKGLIPPAEFIGVAEETGQIVALGRWVLQEAIRQATEWRATLPDRGHLSLSVNVSARQLQDPDLLGQLRRMLYESEFDPADLVLEITESVLMKDMAGTVARLRELKQLGLRLAIDDFGTGYSSLGYLRHFPVDVLKIDRAFVDDIAEGTEQSAVARAIIGLSDALHLTTVAEGIETAGQLRLLRALGCELGQGYYFSPPLQAKAFEALLQRGIGWMPGVAAVA
jgi:diguanylate cyclase (GGDEF)-like protein